jgi:hypothetical protein
MEDNSSIVRASAVWAFQQLSNKKLSQYVKSKHLNIEKDYSVLEEWI